MQSTEADKALTATTRRSKLSFESLVLISFITMQNSPHACYRVSTFGSFSFTPSQYVTAAMSQQHTNGQPKMLNRFFEAHRKIKYVRLQWVDYSGVLHCRIVTKAKSQRTAEDSLPYKGPVNCMITPLSTARGCDASPPQVWELHPTWETLKVYGFAPTHASIMCFLTRTGAANAFSMCPRQLFTTAMKRFELMRQNY